MSNRWDHPPTNRKGHNGHVVGVYTLGLLDNSGCPNLQNLADFAMIWYSLEPRLCAGAEAMNLHEQACLNLAEAQNNY